MTRTPRRRVCKFCGRPLTERDHHRAVTHRGRCQRIWKKQQQAEYDRKRKKPLLRGAQGEEEAMWLDHACFSGGDKNRSQCYIRSYSDCTVPVYRRDRRQKYG